MNELQLEEELKQRDATIAVLLRKFQKVDDERLFYRNENLKLQDTVSRLRKLEIKNVELERNNELLKTEVESLKQMSKYKKILSTVCKALIESDVALSKIKEKVVEQEKLIQVLVKKVENLIEESSSAVKTVDMRRGGISHDKSNSTISTSSSSLGHCYETLDEISFTSQTMTSNDVLIQVYQCPKCKLEISNEIDFKAFTDHVDNCTPDKLICVFCFKFFERKDRNNFINHVNGH